MLIPPVVPPGQSTKFDGHRAYEFARAQVEIGPRPTGSPAGWATGDFILTSLAQSGWAVETQPFVFKGVQGRNIVGKGGQGPVILLGAHYDTRPAADFDSDPARRQQWIDGAHDGARGVAV
ncbi:MAG: M28 family peptidase, partial [Anaerolineae bacterium]|nr:M28 family peptidase [Anaerolineae bacterium]